jgi:Fic family protein
LSSRNSGGGCKIDEKTLDISFKIFYNNKRKGDVKMNFSYIKDLIYQLNARSIPKSVLESFELTFDIEYAHHSTAMEGNTLTLIETKAILEDGISVGGKQLREIYEITNHDKAFKYAKSKIAEGCPLNENIVKDFHEILMENIIQGGIYRNHDVSITGASHTPPTPNEMYSQIKYFYQELQSKSGIDPVELASWSHAEFVRIHPFPDGNGRTARLIMNYQLMSAGLLPINIRTENRIKYYDALDKYASEHDLMPFATLVAEIEEARIRHDLSIEFELCEEISEQQFEQKM